VLAKIALLVFLALAFALEKTKCAICAVGFFQLAGNLFINQVLPD
jgi:hypothetical protein